MIFSNKKSWQKNNIFWFSAIVFPLLCNSGNELLKISKNCCSTLWEDLNTKTFCYASSDALILGHLKSIPKMTWMSHCRGWIWTSWYSSKFYLHHIHQVFISLKKAFVQKTWISHAYRKNMQTQNFKSF